VLEDHAHHIEHGFVIVDEQDAWARWNYAGRDREVWIEGAHAIAFLLAPN